MPELDTANPGTLVAGAENASKYKVFLVLGGAGIGAAQLEQNPDLQSQSIVATRTVADAGGHATVALGDMKSEIDKAFAAKDGKLETFIVAYGNDGGRKAAAGPVLTRPSDLIRIGSQIAPPKKSAYVADMAAEKAWWDRLEETKIANLQPGDILLYKAYDDSDLIVKAQAVFTSGAKGSKYSTHCMVYIGDGKVLSAEPQGVIAWNAWGHCIVYRPKDPARAASAADVARFLVGQKILYSVFHIVEEPFHDMSYGPVAKGRAQKIHRREVPTNAMMCSESVTYCFQDNPDDPTIPLDAPRIGPIHLEDYVNSHPERFTFAGKLLEGGGASMASTSETTKALDAVQAEAKADAQAAGKKISDAGHTVADGAKKLFKKLF
jgi:hypothetical protein